MMDVEQARNLPQGTVVYVTDRAWRFGVEKYTIGHLWRHNDDNQHIEWGIGAFRAPGTGYSARKWAGWSTWEGRYSTEFDQFRFIQVEDVYLNPQEAAAAAEKQIEEPIKFFQYLLDECLKVKRENIDVYAAGGEGKDFAVERQPIPEENR